jgi:hypothetical protein
MAIDSSRRRTHSPTPSQCIFKCGTTVVRSMFRAVAEKGREKREREKIIGIPRGGGGLGLRAK